MAIGANTVWRVRIGADDNNGGGFDASLVGAGTDYTEQDTAQLTLSDLTTSGASATIGSVTGGFTAAMIGNAIRIASGTAFTVGTYFITAVASSNSATVDRNCSTASGSAGVGRVGGAHATLARCTAAGSVVGNTVLVRGQGSNDPVDIDYFTAASVVAPGVTFVGYNGRPKVSHNGILFNNVANTTVKNFSFVQTAATYTTYGVMTGGGCCMVENCVIDSSGFDAQQALDTSLLNCSFINSGTQIAGTKATINSTSATGTGSLIKNCLIKDQRGTGVVLMTGKMSMQDSIVQNCMGNGVEVNATTAITTYSTIEGMSNNTIHGNGGHGITLNGPAANITNNLITGHTGAGKYGIFWTTAPVGYARDFARTAGNNVFGNTADSNYALSALDTTIDPQYVNAPTDLTPTNTALRYLSGVGSK